MEQPRGTHSRRWRAVMLFSRRVMRAVREHGLVIAALCGIVLSSWIVAGTGNLPLIEEWRHLEAYDGAGNYLFAGGPHQVLHPLQGIFHLAAYLLWPDSLRGWPIVLAGLLIAKGIVTYAVVLTLTRGDRFAAFLVAGLFVIFPSDEGTFLFRTVNAHGAVLCALIAFWSLARLWNLGRLSMLWVLLLCATQFVSLMMYDNAIPFLLAAPVLIWLIQPRRPALSLL